MENKKKFYDNVLIVGTIAFLIVVVASTILSEDIFNNLDSIWLIIMWIFFVCFLIFWFGMMYNFYKIKRYGLFVILILLGSLGILQLIFYFSIMRKHFKKE